MPLGTSMNCRRSRLVPSPAERRAFQRRNLLAHILDSLGRLSLRSSFKIAILCVLCIFLSPHASAERDRLYSDLDPSSGGGISGEIVSPKRPVLEVLAIPPDEPRLVYRATVGGPNRRQFSITGLPMRKYDLVVIYDDAFYEGLDLHRDEDTLTTEDRHKINATIQKAEPYFTKKTIHRLEGTTGRGNLCRCICTYMRDRPSTNGRAFRRAFKLVILKDVGPGWQVVRARDLYPTWIEPDKIMARHTYNKQLGRIRVTDYVKDVGEINLTAPQ